MSAKATQFELVTSADVFNLAGELGSDPERLAADHYRKIHAAREREAAEQNQLGFLTVKIQAMN